MILAFCNGSTYVESPVAGLCCWFVGACRGERPSLKTNRKTSKPGRTIAKSERSPEMSERASQPNSTCVYLEDISILACQFNTAPGAFPNSYFPVVIFFSHGTRWRTSGPPAIRAHALSVVTVNASSMHSAYCCGPRWQSCGRWVRMSTIVLYTVPSHPYS